MFLSAFSPRSSNDKASLSPIWSRTVPDTQIPPGSAIPSKSGGDIYPIAVDVPIFPDDDVTQIDADTEYNPLLLGRPRIAFGHPTLHGGRAGDSLYDAREFDENAITGRFDDAA